MIYSAKITEAKKEFSLPDNKSYLDIRFDILREGKVIAERRLAFPLGTTDKEIFAELKKYCGMYQNDHKLAAEAGKRMKEEAEAEETLKGLTGVEVK